MQLNSLLQKIKGAYITWYGYHKTLPKEHRYTLGNKIDNFFIDLIENVSIASFISQETKQPHVKIAIGKNDTLKIFLLILWETKALDNKKYLFISEKINEIGRMLGGWNGQLTKQNSPVKNAGEK